MATNRNAYVTQRPGLEKTGPTTAYLHIDPSEDLFAGLAANPYASAEGKIGLLGFTGSGFGAYKSDQHAETLDSSATITHGAGGLVFALGGSPGTADDITIRSDRTVAVTEGKWVSAFARVQLSDADKVGLTFGIGTSSTAEYQSANPADGIYLHSANNAATLIGRVVENTNAADDTGTLATIVDATDIKIGFRAYLSSTAPALSWYVDGTWYAATADQLTAVGLLVGTTAPTIAAILGFRNESTTAGRTLTAQYAFVDIDR